MNDKMLTPAQVAERFQVVERTVYRWLDAGVLKGVKLGRIWRISESALSTFLSAQTLVYRDRKAEAREAFDAAPMDDEPLTEEDRDAVAEARDDIANGRYEVLEPRPGAGRPARRRP